MTVASQPSNRYLDRPSPSSLADVIDPILDNLVIDIYVRVSLVGIELLTVDARIVKPATLYSADAIGGAEAQPSSAASTLTILRGPPSSVGFPVCTLSWN
jgi:hypothetical protein